MLGKTNITTLTEGGIATEIKDYSWLQIQTGINGNFVKAISKNGYLAAITSNGAVVYTQDGEVWESKVLEYTDCKLNDIEWDGNRFLIAGRCTENIAQESGEAETTHIVGLMLETKDFKTFTKIEIPRKADSCESDNCNHVTEYIAVWAQNGKYKVLAFYPYNTVDPCTSKPSSGLALFTGDLQHEWESTIYGVCYNKLNKTSSSSGFVCPYPESISVAKNSYEMLFCMNVFAGSSCCGIVFKVCSDDVQVVTSLTNNNKNTVILHAIECKDNLFYCSMDAADNYVLAKVSESNEIFTMSIEQNYGFVDGVYYNDCQIFLNRHGILIIPKNKNISDMTVADVMEIAPEVSLNAITKSFGKIFVFGNQGTIIKSSAETDNEEFIAVQAMTAKKALSDANRYTDKKYEELEQRIAAIESKFAAESE